MRFWVGFLCIVGISLTACKGGGNSSVDGGEQKQKPITESLDGTWANQNEQQAFGVNYRQTLQIKNRVATLSQICEQKGAFRVVASVQSKVRVMPNILTFLESGHQKKPAGAGVCEVTVAPGDWDYKLESTQLWIRNRRTKEILSFDLIGL